MFSQVKQLARFSGLINWTQRNLNGARFRASAMYVVVALRFHDSGWYVVQVTTLHSTPLTLVDLWMM